MLFYLPHPDAELKKTPDCNLHCSWIALVTCCLHCLAARLARDAAALQCSSPSHLRGEWSGMPVEEERGRGFVDKGVKAPQVSN